MADSVHDAGEFRTAGAIERIDPRISFDALKQPAEVLAQLRQAAARARTDAASLSGLRGVHDALDARVGPLLFVGPRGSGKSQAAEALAGDLGRPLVRIDLAAVKSKYIGETGKNLARVLDAVADPGNVLLFDEADALFGKRSEIRDSHDRYANLEVIHLLQRLEHYPGVAILATNSEASIDAAFLRRFLLRIDFQKTGR